MQDHQRFQRPILEPLLSCIDSEQQPCWRIEKAYLRVPDQGYSTVDCGIPLRKNTLTQRTKCIVEKWIVVTVEVVRNVDDLERRQVFKEKCVGKK